MWVYFIFCKIQINDGMVHKGYRKYLIHVKYLK